MIGMSVATVGALLVVVGFIVLFGAWAAVVSGVVAVLLGLLVPWEELTRAKPAPPPPRR